MTTNFAWLIEAPGQNYLATRFLLNDHEFHWTKDHNAALRFYSQEQADAVMMAIRGLAPALFGFAVTLGEARPVEHGWMETVQEGRTGMRELTRDEKLVLLIEECGEVIQAATKCLRFGYDNDHGVGYGQNDKVLSAEIGDLLGVIDALPIDVTEMSDHRQRKMAKAEKAKALYGPAAPPPTSGEGK